MTQADEELAELRRAHDIDAAADKAVRMVFAVIDVDIDNPDSVAEFRDDLRFGRKMRKMADHGTLAIIGLLIFGLGTALWAGISVKLKGL